MMIKDLSLSIRKLSGFLLLLNYLVLGCFLWISPAILVWQGTAISITLWILMTGWILAYIYIFEKIAQKSGFLGEYSYRGTLVEVIFVSFSRNLALSCLIILIGLISLTIPAMALFFEWMLRYGFDLADTSWYSPLIMGGFLLFVVIVSKYYQHLAGLLAWIQLGTILLLFVFVGIGIAGLWHSEGVITIPSKPLVDSLPIIGLIIFHFSTLAFWDSSQAIRTDHLTPGSLKMKMSLVVFICLLQILVVLLIPYLFNANNFYLGSSFLPLLLDAKIPLFYTKIIAGIILLLILGNGIYCVYVLKELLQRGIKLDYHQVSGVRPFHLAHFKYATNILTVLIISWLAWFLLTGRWDLMVLMRLGGLNLLVFFILMSKVFLKYYHTAPARIGGALFMAGNIIVLPFFGWLLLYPFALIFLAIILDSIRLLRSKELSIHLSGRPTWRSKLKMWFRKY